MTAPERWTPRLGDRSLFPDLDTACYLNHAAVSPISSAARAAIERAVGDYARIGLGAIPIWIDQRDRLRAQLAALLGARSDDIALVANTTAGVHDIGVCLPWQRGDRVIGFRGEFPTNVTPWQQIGNMFDVAVTLLPIAPFERSHAEGLAALEAELAAGARLVAVSAVQFQTGLRMPLDAMGALCHRYGAELFVDAAQACGAVPISVASGAIDYLACSGHKWMMGVEGAGFLYISPRRLAALRPHIAGWLSHDGALDFLLKGPGHMRYDRPLLATAARFDVGSCNTLGYAALGASLGLIAELGVPAIFAHINEFLDQLEPFLLDRGFRSLRAVEPAGRSTILSAMPPDGLDVIALQRALDERGVACSTPDGALRFSPHWPNHIGELARIEPALDASLAAVSR